MSTKPVIILVPGAWHPPSAFDPLTKHLNNNGYTTEGISLPTVGSTTPEPNFDGDVKTISSAIRKHADQGHDVIVLVHSYGGVPGSSACRGLVKSGREAQGKKGGVVHVIYVAAFALNEGLSLMDGLGGQPLPWFDISSDEKTLTPKTPRETFYNEIKDQDTVEKLVAKLKPHSYGALFSKNSYAVWEDVDTTYVVCERDAALPAGAQVGMLEGIQGGQREKGLKVGMGKVVLEGADHSPFVERAEELGGVVRRIAGESV